MNDSINILVIDDSEDDCDLYGRVLSKMQDADYIMQEAHSGEEGEKKAQDTAPDCILLDYSLPGRNGLEVLKRLRNKPHQHPHCYADWAGQ